MLLLFTRFSKLLGADYLTCLDVDGVENYRALDVTAAPSIALDLKPPIVGQSAEEGALASKIYCAHFLTASLIDARTE